MIFKPGFKVSLVAVCLMSGGSEFQTERPEYEKAQDGRYDEITEEAGVHSGAKGWRSERVQIKTVREKGRAGGADDV